VDKEPELVDVYHILVARGPDKEKSDLSQASLARVSSSNAIIIPVIFKMRFAIFPMVISVCAAKILHKSL